MRSLNDAAQELEEGARRCQELRHRGQSEAMVAYLDRPGCVVLELSPQGARDVAASLRREAQRERKEPG